MLHDMHDCKIVMVIAIVYNIEVLHKVIMYLNMPIFITMLSNSGELFIEPY